MAVGGSLTLNVCSWESFPPIGLPYPASITVRTSALSNCILFCHVWFLSLGGLREWSLGEGGGKSGGREALVRIYCIKEESVFSKNEN